MRSVQWSSFGAEPAKGLRQSVRGCSTDRVEELLFEENFKSSPLCEIALV